MSFLFNLYRINSTHVFLAGGFAGPSTLCGIDTNAGPQYNNYDGYDYGTGDYPPIDYSPSDYPTSKRAANDDYEDYTPENVSGDQKTLHQSDSDYIFYEDQDKKVSLNPVGKRPSFCDDPDVAPDAYTGGLVLKKAYLYNGLAWEEMPPMSVRRDTLMCSLIQKDDQVLLIYFEIFLGLMK